MHLRKSIPLSGRLSSFHYSVISSGKHLKACEQKRKSPVVSHHIGLVNLFSRYQLITSAELEISETEQAFIVTIPLIQTGIYEGVDH